MAVVAVVVVAAIFVALAFVHQQRQQQRQHVSYCLFALAVFFLSFSLFVGSYFFLLCFCLSVFKSFCHSTASLDNFSVL